MKKNYLEEIKKQLHPTDIAKNLLYIYDKFKNSIIIATSLGLEDQIIIHEAAKINKNLNTFTLDTGRLPQETYDLITETEKFYGIKIKIYFPDYKSVEEMVNKYGINLFYESVENRKLCCYIRKVEPLMRALKGYKLWITGLRKEQSLTREKLDIIEWDQTHKLFKLNPLINWTTQMVVEYIKKEKIPYNKLHDNNYPSIGCTPCTRAIKIWEDIRDGRWWWEKPTQKECGIHIKDGKIIRIRRGE